MTKKELKKLAVACIDFNKGVDHVLVTTDGQCFLPKAKSYAQTHAHKTGTEVYKFTAEELGAEPADELEEDNGTLADLTNAELKVLAKDNGLAIKGRNKNDILLEIEQHNAQEGAKIIELKPDTLEEAEGDASTDGAAEGDTPTKGAAPTEGAAKGDTPKEGDKPTEGAKENTNEADGVKPIAD